MSEPDLDSIQRDIEELRRAIRTNNPLLREIADSKAFALLSLPFGLLILAFCLASHFLVLAYGSERELPESWKIIALSFIALFVIAGGIAKWLLLKKRTAEIEKRTTPLGLLKDMYSGASFHANVPPLICIFAAAAFALSVGHPWFIVSSTAIFFSFATNGLASLMRGQEYWATGWFALATGILSLFFIESAPYLWSAAIWGGSFIVFGIVGLRSSSRARADAAEAGGSDGL